MARRTTLLALEQIREINMTPLIDLTFLLLITFIITFPLIEQGIPVKLPRGQADPLDERTTRSITLDGQGKLYLDTVPITREELQREIRLIGRTDPDVTVLVRADESLVYGRLVDVMAMLHEAKIARLALVTAADEHAKP